METYSLLLLLATTTICCFFFYKSNPLYGSWISFEVCTSNVIYKIQIRSWTGKCNDIKKVLRRHTISHFILKIIDVMWSRKSFLLFVQSFNCLCLRDQLPNLCEVFTKLKPKQYPNRKCPPLKKKIIFFDFRLILLDCITYEGLIMPAVFSWILWNLHNFLKTWKSQIYYPGGGTQLWVGYGCAARSFDHNPISKPEKAQIRNLCPNHFFLEGPFLKPISSFDHVNWDA